MGTATMLSPFCCMISCRTGTNFTVPVVGSTTRMKIGGARKSADWISKGAECACVHLFSVVGSCRQHPVHLHLRKGWSISNPSTILELRLAPLGTTKVIFETVSVEASSGESKHAASKLSWIGLPAVAVSLSAMFSGQPAYAEVKPNVLAEVSVQMEVVMDTAPSVESILAKQLARRFREMTDEELVDILQQLLKASGSSLSSQKAVEDGIRPEDLVIQNEKRQIETKAAERTRDQEIPATQEIDPNSRKDDKDRNTVSETQGANVQGLKETPERDGGGINFPQASTKNGQVDERETQKLSEKAKDQQQEGKALSLGKGNDGKTSSEAPFSETKAAVPPTTENDAGDVSARRKLDSSDTGVTGAADKNARDGSREDEDLTELLWAEWSQRVGGQIVEEPKPSGTSFNFIEFGQEVIKKVSEFTALQKAIGVFTIWSVFMVLAYRLGRARASRKEIPTSKEAPIDYLDNRDLSSISSDSRARGDTKRGPANLSDEDFYFFKDSVNGRTPRYPSSVSLNTVDSKSTELQATGDRPRRRGFQRPLEAEWRKPEVRDIGEHTDEEEMSTPDGSYASKMLKSPIVDSWQGKFFHHRGGISPTSDQHSAWKTGTDRTTASRQIPMKPQQPIVDDWGEGSSMFDSNEQVKQKDSPEVVSAKPGARELEGSAASQSEAELNSFVHDHVLWVRDDDGIFIRQGAAMEEGDGRNVTSFFIREQDMPESTPLADERSDLPSSMALIKQRKGLAKRFDYGQLVIESRDQHLPKDQQGFATENEPDALRGQMWPLRYVSGRQTVS